jgi:hypothetical protein
LLRDGNIKSCKTAGERCELTQCASGFDLSNSCFHSADLRGIDLF